MKTHEKCQTFTPADTLEVVRAPSSFIGKISLLSPEYQSGCASALACSLTYKCLAFSSNQLDIQRPSIFERQHCATGWELILRARLGVGVRTDYEHHVGDCDTLQPTGSLSAVPTNNRQSRHIHNTLRRSQVLRPVCRSWLL